MMTRSFVVRGVLAGMFAVSTAAAGLAVTASAAGAAPPPPNCTVPLKEAAATVPTSDTEPGRCATLEVTKVVTGAPAPQMTFDVVVDCVPVEVPRASDALPPGQVPPFTNTLTFPAAGGTQDVFIARPSDCTTSETPPPGCTLTSIDPVTTHVRQDIVYPVTVTNDCPAPPPTTTAPPAAVAVVQAPRFTG
jgi:hypothetical protein